MTPHVSHEEVKGQPLTFPAIGESPLLLLKPKRLSASAPARPGNLARLAADRYIPLLPRLMGGSVGERTVVTGKWISTLFICTEIEIPLRL